MPAFCLCFCSAALEACDPVAEDESSAFVAIPVTLAGKGHAGGGVGRRHFFLHLRDVELR